MLTRARSPHRRSESIYAMRYTTSIVCMLLLTLAGCTVRKTVVELPKELEEVAELKEPLKDVAALKAPMEQVRP